MTYDLWHCDWHKCNYKWCWLCQSISVSQYVLILIHYDFQSNSCSYWRTGIIQFIIKYKCTCWQVILISKIGRESFTCPQSRFQHISSKTKNIRYKTLKDTLHVYSCACEIDWVIFVHIWGICIISFQVHTYAVFYKTKIRVVLIY